MKTITVNVTADDIKQGVKRSAKQCPIARSFCRLITPGYDFSVGGIRIIVGSVNKPFCEIFMTSIGSEFVVNFDKGEMVEPFTMQFCVPDDFPLAEPQEEVYKETVPENAELVTA